MNDDLLRVEFAGVELGRSTALRQSASAVLVAVSAVGVMAAIMVWLGGVLSTLIVVLSLALFVTPGLCLWRLIEPTSTVRPEFAEFCTIGAVIGLGFSTTITVLVTLACGFRPVAVAVILGAVSTGLAVVNSRRARSMPHVARPRGPIVAIGSVFVVAVSLALSISYANFAQQTERGIRFSNLHKTDLLHHMVTASELTRAIPPQNPYFSGEVLHYFWWAHVLPAFGYAVGGHSSTPRDIIVLAALTYSALAVLAILVALRTVVSDRRVLCVLMTLSVLAAGYSDVVVLARWLITSVPGHGSGGLLNYLFTDDWGGAYTGYSHGLFRSFLVEPHSTVAMALLAVQVVLIVRHGFPGMLKRIAVIQGLLLGWTLATDTFIGLLVATTWAIAGIVAIAHHPAESKRATTSFVLVGVAASPVLLMMVYLHMVEPGQKTLLLKPYTTLIALAPFYFLADYGALAVAGLAGVISAVRQGRRIAEPTRSFLVLTTVCVFAMFFVTHVEVGTQVFRKAGLVLRVPLAALAGSAIAGVIEHGRPWLRRLLLLGVAAALPSVVTDVSRISGFGPVPDQVFYVSADDAAAYEWMKRHVAREALVQELPGAIPGVVALGEHRTALGDWVHASNYQIGEPRVLERHKAIYRTLFLGRDAAMAHAIAIRYGIAYLFIGREAREKATPEALDKFATAPAYFEPVYGRGGAVIYRVRHHG